MRPRPQSGPLIDRDMREFVGAVEAARRRELREAPLLLHRVGRRSWNSAARLLRPSVGSGAGRDERHEAQVFRGRVAGCSGYVTRIGHRVADGEKSRREG
jgi:hypothetical protein